MNLGLVEIRKSKIRNAGDGCFASTFIPKGTLLGPYRGKYMTAKERASVSNGAYIWKINENRFIDAIHHVKNNPLRYVNGAKTPTQTSRINCAVRFIGDTPSKEKVYYITTKDIPHGEELIISYGKIYFKNAPKNAP
jgi:hypothetical protein